MLPLTFPRQFCISVFLFFKLGLLSKLGSSLLVCVFSPHFCRLSLIVEDVIRV